MGVRSEPSGRARAVFHDFEAHSGSVQRESREKCTALPTGAVGAAQVRQAPRADASIRRLVSLPRPQVKADLTCAPTDWRLRRRLRRRPDGVERFLNTPRCPIGRPSPVCTALFRLQCPPDLEEAADAGFSVTMGVGRIPGWRWPCSSAHFAAGSATRSEPRGAGTPRSIFP